MLDKSLFAIDIAGNQAEISFGAYGRATLLEIENRCAQVVGYVGHSHDRNAETGQDKITITVQSSDINNCVEQAKVVLAGQ
jgi:hypothetical protein